MIQALHSSLSLVPFSFGNPLLVSALSSASFEFIPAPRPPRRGPFLTCRLGRGCSDERLRRAFLADPTRGSAVAHTWVASSRHPFAFSALRSGAKGASRRSIRRNAGRDRARRLHQAPLFVTFLGRFPSPSLPSVTPTFRARLPRSCPSPRP